MHLVASVCLSVTTLMPKPFDLRPAKSGLQKAWTMQCPGFTCGINIAKPRFLSKTVDLLVYEAILKMGVIITFQGE